MSSETSRSAATPGNRLVTRRKEISGFAWTEVIGWSSYAADGDSPIFRGAIFAAAKLLFQGNVVPAAKIGTVPSNVTRSGHHAQPVQENRTTMIAPLTTS